MNDNTFAESANARYFVNVVSVFVKDGRYHVKPAQGSYDMIYRAARGVYWDNDTGSLFYKNVVSKEMALNFIAKAMEEEYYTSLIFDNDKTEQNSITNVENYVSRLIKQLKSSFKNRLVYVGLQGSYLRGEATANSDIDIVVILDALTTADLDCYRSIIQSLEHPDKSCGFICGKSELAKWNTLEIHHLLNSTKDYYGVLSELVPNYTIEDVRNFIKLSVNNIYHAICHSYIHGKQEENISAIPLHYKGAFFILQNLYYLNHGRFIKTKGELLPLLNANNRAVLNRSMEFTKGVTCDFPEDFDLLFTWCQEIMQSI